MGDNLLIVFARCKYSALEYFNGFSESEILIHAYLIDACAIQKVIIKKVNKMKQGLQVTNSDQISIY